MRFVSSPRHSHMSLRTSPESIQFRQGYPEVSQHNQSQSLQNWKQNGRLIEGTKGAEFIEGLVPQDVRYRCIPVLISLTPVLTRFSICIVHWLFTRGTSS